MSHTSLVESFSLLCPWLALVCLMQFVAGRCGIRRRGAMRLLILGLLAAGVLALPIRGFTVGSWIRGIEANFSILFTVLLAGVVWEGEFHRRLFAGRERFTGWVFGMLGSLFLYPLALGLGNFDPYEWGWRFSPLFVSSAALCGLLIWQQNRFGLVLLLAIVAYHLGLLESKNYWDYLVDPVYFVVSVLVLLFGLISRFRRPQPGEAEGAT